MARNIFIKTIFSLKRNNSSRPFIWREAFSTKTIFLEKRKKHCLYGLNHYQQDDLIQEEK